MEAENYTKAIASEPYKWVTIPNLGRTASGVSLQPSNSAPLEISENFPYARIRYLFFRKRRC